MNQNTWTDYSGYFEENELKAGFTNRYFSYEKPVDRIEFANILSLDSQKIVYPKQVHSSEVIVCSRPGKYLDVDGVLSQKRDLVLSIQVADCIPIFICDKSSQIIGLVHAGWRGISKAIVKSTLDKLNDIGSRTSKLQILLGPSILQCCFEIGPEVATLFNAKFLIEGDGDRWYLDLKGFAINEFKQFGIEDHQIINIEECTCCSKKYHSYRRDGKEAGRMIAMMGFLY